MYRGWALVAGAGSTLNVDCAEHREDDGLDQAEQKAEDIHDEGNDDRAHLEKLMSDRFLAEDVAVQTKGQREGTHDLFDDVQRQHECQGADEVLQVAEAVGLEAQEMRCQEDDDRKARSHGKRGSGRLQPGNVAGKRKQAGVVGHQNEDEHRAEQREVVSRSVLTQDASEEAVQG